MPALPFGVLMAGVTSRTACLCTRASLPDTSLGSTEPLHSNFLNLSMTGGLHFPSSGIESVNTEPHI